VTRQLLDVPQIDSLLEEVCCEGVASVCGVNRFSMPARRAATEMTFCTLRALIGRSGLAPGNSHSRGAKRER
jgi:hypothetical protein